MNTKRLGLIGCTFMILSVGSANAGPCNSTGKDAGSGPTPGYTGKSITTGSANSREHPPTETMNRVTGAKATSSQDTQKQMQGQPTAAQQAEGAAPSATPQGNGQSEKMADQGC
jgi:hypothetical protein